MYDEMTWKGAEVTDIWRLYDEGRDYFERRNLASRTEQCFRFVQGDQWEGLKCGAQRPAQLNILQPIMKSATAMVGQNTMSIHYSTMNYEPEMRGRMQALCGKLNGYAAQLWEHLKLDRHCWDILQDAFICGDSFAYFYDKDGEVAFERLDNLDVMLGDELNPEVQEQPYILIVQRRYIEDVRREAKKNGLGKDEIELILPDEEEIQPEQGREIKSQLKCTSVMKLWKDEGALKMAKSTRNVVYQPETVIAGMSLYPLAKYSWKVEKGYARGLGDIWDKIPNQISVNKALYRFEAAVKASAYPHKIYNRNMIDPEQIDKLSLPDSNIAVSDPQMVGVDRMLAYMQPANISPYARSLYDDLMQQTRALSGAGDNLENINPEQASGAAITAAREAKALNVNNQVAAYKQFVEDIALIWFELWLAYHPDGLEVPADDGQGHEWMERVPVEELGRLKVHVRIDVSPNNPYSKMAQDMSLKELFQAGAITFEEYVAALEDDSVMPRGKLETILEDRKKQKQQEQSELITQLAMRQKELLSENMGLKGDMTRVPELLEQAKAQGGAEQAERAKQEQDILALQQLAAQLGGTQAGGAQGAAGYAGADDAGYAGGAAGAGGIAGQEVVR